MGWGQVRSRNADDRREIERWRDAYHQEQAARHATLNELEKWRDLAVKRGNKLDAARDLLEGAAKSYVIETMHASVVEARDLVR